MVTDPYRATTTSPAYESTANERVEAKNAECRKNHLGTLTLLQYNKGQWHNKGVPMGTSDPSASNEQGQLSLPEWTVANEVAVEMSSGEENGEEGGDCGE